MEKAAVLRVLQPDGQLLATYSRSHLPKGLTVASLKGHILKEPSTLSELGGEPELFVQARRLEDSEVLAEVFAEGEDVELTMAASECGGDCCTLQQDSSSLVMAADLTQNILGRIGVHVRNQTRRNLGDLLWEAVDGDLFIECLGL